MGSGSETQAMKSAVRKARRVADAENSARVQVIETKLEHFALAINELTKAVKDIASRPQQIAWREIAVTAGAFLALFAYVGNYLEGQYSKNIAVERYRIEQAERKLCTIAPTFCTK